MGGESRVRRNNLICSQVKALLLLIDEAMEVARNATFALGWLFALNL